MQINNYFFFSLMKSVDKYDRYANVRTAHHTTTYADTPSYIYIYNVCLIKYYEKEYCQAKKNEKQQLYHFRCTSLILYFFFT